MNYLPAVQPRFLSLFCAAFIIASYVSICAEHVQKPIKLIEKASIENNRLTVYAEPAFQKHYLRAPFFVEYDLDGNVALDLQSLDYSSAIMPFIMSVLPIIWASGKTYIIDQMDEELYHAQEDIKKVFRLFYPDTPWSGTLVARSYVKHTVTPKEVNNTPVCMVSYSGGLDSTYTSFTYLPKKQHLFLIKNDRELHLNNHWQQAKKTIKEFARKHGHTCSFARSNWHNFLRGKTLSSLCPNIPSMWWGYTTQSLGYAGLAAPILLTKQISALVIGATHTKSFTRPWGSHPLLDKEIRFAGIHLEHSGYEATRFEKLAYLVNECKVKNIEKPVLRVCNRFGYLHRRNCCRCEKCLRTTNGLYILGENPKDYGFCMRPNDIVRLTKQKLASEPHFTNGLTFHWQDLQKRAAERLVHEKDQERKKYLRFLKNYDIAALNEQKELEQIADIDWETGRYRNGS